MTNQQTTINKIDDLKDIDLRVEASNTRQEDYDGDDRSDASEWQNDNNGNEIEDDNCNTDDDTDDKSVASTSSSVSDSLSSFDAVCILTTWATSGSIVAVPWAISQLGYILGPLLLISFVSMSVYFFNFLLDVADTCKEGTCKTLGDVGYELAGKKGRILFNAFQIGNLILYMPVALETVGLSLQYLANGSCIGWFNIFSFAGLLFMVQFFRCWNHVAWVAYITVTIAAAKAFILLPYAFVEYQDEIVNSDDYRGPVQAFGNPEPAWDLYALAVSTFFFCFTPMYILLEIRDGMGPNKSECKKALSVSAAIQLLMYLVPSLVCVFIWGWNISSPITLEIPTGFLGVILSLIVLIAVALDFCIAAKITNDWLARFFPSSLKGKQSGSLCGQALYRLAYSMPSSLFSLILVLAIPNFETLVGIVTGITIIGISNWAITLAWEMGDRKVETNPFFMWFGAIVGFVLTIWVVAAAIEAVATTDYSSHFFCSGS